MDGYPCTFPFKFKGVIHNECTWTEGDGKPWCAILVDEFGPNVEGDENRGVCGPGCPIPPNPANAKYSGLSKIMMGFNLAWLIFSSHLSF